MRFTKIKYAETKKEVILDWTEVKSETGDILEMHLSSRDEPRQAFIDGIAHLKRYVLEMCDLDDEFLAEWGELLRPISCTLKDTAHGRGIVITCLRPVAITAAPIIINTPFLLTEQWPTGLAEAVVRLEREAARYALGERATQEEIPLEEPAQRDLEGMTMSINGGPQVPFAIVEEALAILRQGARDMGDIRAMDRRLDALLDEETRP